MNANWQNICLYFSIAILLNKLRSAPPTSTGNILLSSTFATNFDIKLTSNYAAGDISPPESSVALINYSFPHDTPSRTVSTAWRIRYFVASRHNGVGWAPTFNWTDLIYGCKVSPLNYDHLLMLVSRCKSFCSAFSVEAVCQDLLNCFMRLVILCDVNSVLFMYYALGYQ